MTIEQLQAELEELEALNKSGNDYARVEIRARELLNVLTLMKDKSVVEVGSLSEVEAGSLSEKVEYAETIKPAFILAPVKSRKKRIKLKPGDIVKFSIK